MRDHVVVEQSVARRIIRSSIPRFVSPSKAHSYRIQCAKPDRQIDLKHTAFTVTHSTVTNSRFTNSTVGQQRYPLVEYKITELL